MIPPRHQPRGVTHSRAQPLTRITPRYIPILLAGGQAQGSTITEAQLFEFKPSKKAARALEGVGCSAGSTSARQIAATPSRPDPSFEVVDMPTPCHSRNRAGMARRSLITTADQTAADLQPLALALPHAKAAAVTDWYRRGVPSPQSARHIQHEPADHTTDRTTGIQAQQGQPPSQPLLKFSPASSMHSQRSRLAVKPLPSHATALTRTRAHCHDRQLLCPH